MKYILTSFFWFILFFFSSFGFAVDDQNWDFSNSQRWIGDSAEGLVDFCQEKSIRWDNPQLGFDINSDDIDDFMVAISCYQGEAPSDGAKHNLKVRAAWKMYCSANTTHYDCTEELFRSDVIEVTAVPPDIALGNDGGGNPYFNVMEKPRDLNNDGFPEFWYAVNRDDGRSGFDFNNNQDRALLEEYCGPQAQSGDERWLWDCTRKSIQTMLVSNSDGTYQIKEMPWGAQNTQAVLILPNSIGTFDVWALIYGPHKVARYTNGDFIDVTSEYELDPLWDKITQDNPYAKAFSHDDSFYIAKADIPQDYRPDWAADVANSGFILLEYKVGEGFSVSDVFTPEVDETFFYKIRQGDSVQSRFGTMVKDVPVFDPRWHFFDFEILDNSKEPVLIVQSEAFTQAGNAFKAPFDSEIIYTIGDKLSSRSTEETIWGGYSAVEGFYIRNGKLVARSEPIIDGNGIHSADYKRFVDIDSDGFIDAIVGSGEGRPSLFINNGSGTLEKVFLGDIFPDLFSNSDYWELAEDHNIAGWGAVLYPFYSSDKVDLLYWTRGYQFRMPSFLPDGYEFSPGDIVLAKSKVNISQVKKFSAIEQQTLFETCIVNGYFATDGFQLACNMGTPFPNDSEVDSDGDGVVDSQDDLRFNAAESIDTDDDGIGNNEDADDDNDGVDDSSDAFPLDDTETNDFDADGIGDNEDTDDDNDGVPDTNDSYPYNGNHDSDGDGVNNLEDAFPQNNLYSSDSDQDGMPDIWEMLYGLDPYDASDASSDEDLDGASARAEFLANVIPSFSLDIDGNGKFDALTDGLLVLRSLFGLSDDSLITGALAADASVTDSESILSKVSALGSRLDIDKNGSVDALTDGLIILRYLFGLRGDAMTSNVLANDADRTDIVELERYLKGISSSNLQAPMFLTSSEYRVTEGQIEIGQILVTDADSDDNLITFSIDSEEILVSSAGELTFVEAPDIENKSIYSAVVTASDGENSSLQQIRISIKYKYEYADHWDEINAYRQSLRSIYENPIGINQEETWFKTFTIPKSKFTTDITNTFLDDENFRGDVGYDTWINVGDSTFHLNCNWIPQNPNEGAIKIIELIDGVFANLYYKQIEGCNHSLPLKNSDGSFQIVFPGHDEGKISAGLAPYAKSFVFNVSTKEFFDMNITLASHGQGIFDYDLDGDDDIITTGASWFANDPNAIPLTKNCGEIGIMQNNGLNDFNLITVPMPNDVSNPDTATGLIPNEGCGGAMSADAYVQDGILYVVYTDFNSNPRHTNPEWIIEPEKNVVVKYDASDLSILEIVELPTPYVEANFINLEYYQEDQHWIGGNGKSHDTHSQFLDIDYDGDKDILISNQSYWHEKTSVLQIIINNNGSYEDETADRLFNWNIRTGNLHEWSFSDVNGDGYLDITTTDGCGGAQNDLGIPRNFGCEKKVAINDGTGHFLQIIGPMEIYQVYENNEYKTGQLGSIFALDSNRNLKWTYMTGKGCSDGCYANGDWDVFIVSLDSLLSTGPAGMDPSVAGEPGFNEFYYLLHYPNVRDAVQKRIYENGLEHYIAAGKDLGYLPNAKSLTNIVVEEYGVNPVYTIN